MKVDEEKDVVVIFLEEYYVEELVGKEVIFKIKVNEIKFKEVLELIDEIVNELDVEVNIVDEYKENLCKCLVE